MSNYGNEEINIPTPAAVPRKIQAVAKATIADDNVWQWIHDAAASSPIQPTVNLGTGFIDHNPPEFLIEAHKKALDSVDSNQYAPVTGSDLLRQTIAELYSPLYGRQLNPVIEVCVTSGAQYIYQIKMAGGTTRYIPLRPPKSQQKTRVSGNDWSLDIAELEAAITSKTKMIYLNNPHNPLGKVFTVSELTAIGNLCVKHRLILLSNEVYERIGCNPSHTLTTVSLDKLLNATGWRVGFVIGYEALIQPVIATHLVLAYSSSGPAQDACVVGLREAEKRGWWSVSAEDVGARIRRLCRALDETGLTYVAPPNAWFVVNIDKINLPKEYKYPPLFGIASIPGSCFYGPDHKALGERYVRFGACKSDAGFELAEQRLALLRPHVSVSL
ncbi:PLP-dependent transferase [Lentithecium fluviatile CBS 122367]|uniref:PLP-dependent transferase n=1 Tax=Lentithecium fluviatile CBS 122367 TaxID=1168545 RepID=A0A6G1JNB3_9PLEO|nr:PLP-dependent transferase [Lentithecium fluviatile CBS 122367]